MKPLKGWLIALIIVASNIVWMIVTFVIFIFGVSIYTEKHRSYYDYYDYYDDEYEVVEYLDCDTVAVADTICNDSSSYYARLSSYNVNSTENGNNGVRLWVDFYNIEGRYDQYTRLRLTVWDENNTGVITYDGQTVECSYYFTPDNYCYSGTATFFIPYYKLRAYGSGTYTFDMELMRPYEEYTISRSNNIGAVYLSSDDIY